MDFTHENPIVSYLGWLSLNLSDFPCDFQFLGAAWSYQTETSITSVQLLQRDGHVDRDSLILRRGLAWTHQIESGATPPNPPIPNMSPNMNASDPPSEAPSDQHGEHTKSRLVASERVRTVNLALEKLREDVVRVPVELISGAAVIMRRQGLNPKPLGMPPWPPC